MTANFLYKSEPYRHQTEAVHKCYPLDFFALFMEQGTGKTKTLIDIATNLYAEKTIDAVLVIAPNGVHEQWADTELPLHHTESVPRRVFVWNNRAKHSSAMLRLNEMTYKKSEVLKWVFVNVDAFSSDNFVGLFKEYVKNNKTMVVVDEATRIKNPDVKRSQNIKFGLSDTMRQGKRIVKVFPFSVRRAVLTGTMVTNSPYDLWNMFEFLKPNFWGIDFFTFKMRYGIERRMTINGARGTYYRKITTKELLQIRKYAAMGKQIDELARIFSVSESSIQFVINNPHINAPYKNLEQLKQAIEPYSFIVRKKDCMDLPPKIYEKIFVEMNAEQKRVYREMLHEMEAEYEGKELTALNKIGLILRLQQITGGFFPTSEPHDDEPLAQIGKSNPKIEALMDDLEECSDYPVIVAARFRAEIQSITKSLAEHFEDKRIECIFGDTPTAERRELREAFMNNEIDILVASARIIGTGFNLQICHTMYLYSNSYSFEDRAQLEDRIHRNGQLSDTVVYKDILVKKSVDEQIYEVLQNKKDLLEYMRDKSLTEFIGRQKEEEE